MSTALVKGSIRGQFEEDSWDTTERAVKWRTDDEVFLTVVSGSESEAQPVVKVSKATLAAP
ncbi:hypothetical protein [Allocoleopsis sp.]|uniref:hypothetical protein n=1 Tax=Allocoleopsis sp. TaxID=3088169 RepID=UPI002FD6F26F